MKVGLIGYGYWGVNIARTISQNKNFSLEGIFDLDSLRCQKAQEDYPNIRLFDTLEELFASPIEAVFIVVPSCVHYEVIHQALVAGKHVFVEKPFTKTVHEAKELIELAHTKKCILMVDHIFLFSEPVKYLKEHLESFGNIMYVSSRRMNLGLFRDRDGAIEDLVVHDLAIIDYLFGLDIQQGSVHKQGYKDYSMGNEAFTNVSFNLHKTIEVHLHASWAYPSKVRELVLIGDRKMVVYDDLAAEKIKIYNTGLFLDTLKEDRKLYNHNLQIPTPFVPELKDNFSLDNAIEHFRQCVDSNTKSDIAGEDSIITIMAGLETIKGLAYD